MKIAVIIPALNEENSITNVLQDLPREGHFFKVVDCLVVDNGSTDRTATRAQSGGARVIFEPKRGYGQACWSGMMDLQSKVHADPQCTPDVVVFLDADYSDKPQELEDVIRPIADEKKQFVVGSRILGPCEKGALLPQARYGNWLATTLMKLFFGFRFTDLGPFRAMNYVELMNLGMTDRGFGWTVEMQARALMRGLNVAEVPVSYRKRVGVSKITGTIQGTLKAGIKILWTLFYLKFVHMVKGNRNFYGNAYSLREGTRTRQG